MRPLLHLRRDDVRRAAREAGLATVEDPTNADVERRRNLVRRDVLPALGGVSGGAGTPSRCWPAPRTCCATTPTCSTAWPRSRPRA